jgi:phosphopantetheinyl transferase (holo-ACP synthase)
LTGWRKWRKNILSCIGNDVVDWKHPANAKKSSNFRYLKKILTDVEIEFIHDAENPDRALWSLWACKETAYKVISKSYAGLFFLPRHWSVQLNWHDNALIEGEVIIPGVNTVFVRLYCPEGCVHCVGSDNLLDLDDIIWSIDPVLKSASDENVDPSLFVRECLSRRLASIYQLNLGEMEIRRAKKGRELQPPQLYYENKKTPFDISLSHDGQFVAYAFLKQLY